MKAYVQCPKCHNWHEVEMQPAQQPAKMPEKRRKIGGAEMVWLFLIGFILLAAVAQFAGPVAF